MDSQLQQCNCVPTSLPPSSEVNSPDGWLFGAFYFQIIRLLLHLKFCEHQRDGVAWISQYGPLTFPAAAQASSTTPSGRARGVTAGKIKAGDEPTGAPKGATTRILGCQSPRQKNRVGKNTYIYSGLFPTFKSNGGKESLQA